MIISLIIACEIGFWIVLGLGLVTRYLLRKPKAGMILLLCVPLLDIILLTAAGLDLYRGATADFSHGLAAVYLGFTIAFGHSMIRWADARFAHRFAGGPAPFRAPSHGWAYTFYEWKLWLKALLACAISSGILWAGTQIGETPEQTEVLLAWIPTLVKIVVIWLLVGPLWYSVWPKKAAETESS